MPDPLIYLDAAAVNAAMPAVDQRIELARQTMIALVENAELPPKVGVHPRAAASYTSAMPALLRAADADGAPDLLLGIKWVTAYPNNRGRGIDAIHATVILNDASTGAPLAILDGAPITAQRTAAVSGVALRYWWPKGVSQRTVALIGAGVQGQSHLEVLTELTIDADLTIASRHLQHASELADVAAATERFASVRASDDIVAAVRGADVVLTMIAFGSPRQIVPADAFGRAALIIAVDYDMCVPAPVARGASLFVTDDAAQLRATRQGEVFAGYPDPDASIGEALLGRAATSRASGPVFVDHLGVGLADVVFADAIVRRARELGLGIKLSR